MPLFDTHAHLDQPEFDDDRAEMIARAEAAGVAPMLAVGITAESSAAVVRLAQQYSSVHAAVGIQPNYCGQAAPDDWQWIVDLVTQPRVVAIGETGLDRHWDYTPFDVQQDYFARHLELSREKGLPFIVHTRDSDADVLAMLREAARGGPLRGVMHSFTGTAETAAECIALGMHISLAGMITFEKSEALRAVAATVPIDRLLIETDSPYLAPHPLRGKRNEPANLVYTAQCLADVLGLSLEVLAERTTANAKRLFAVP
jgi:TatD DNase family protein